MTPSKRIENIRELLADYWFVDNPNSSEVNEEIGFLLNRLEAAERTIASVKKYWPNVVDLCACDDKEKCCLCEACEALSSYSGGAGE